MSPRWTAGVRREVLPNGLTVLVKRDDSAPAASVITHVKAGFFDEPDHWVGVSHVLEHMFFKGTARRGPGDIARETKSAGGYLNASTSYDRTCYYVVLPAARLAAAIDIQADALRNSVIDPGELSRELGVIIQEAKRKLDTPASVTHETLHEIMYDRHRIRRWRIGREEDLARFTRADVWGYYRSRYVPGRVIIAVVGQVDEDEALDLVRHAYGDWPAATAAIEASPTEPERSDVRTRTLRGDVAQAHLALGWRAVPPLHPDAPALDLAAAVLGTGRGSWLYRGLREPGVVTSISASFYAPTELGVFSANAEFNPARLNEAVTGIMRAIGRLADAGPSPDDMDRARTLLLTRWARRMEPTDGTASALASAEAARDVTYLDEEFEALGNVTASEVRQAAARYLTPAGMAGVAYLPPGDGTDLDPGVLLAPDEGPPIPAMRTAAPGSSRRRSTRPSAHETAGVWHAPLPGADLLVRHKRGVPTVTLGLYLPRSAPDAPDTAGIGALAVRSAVRGAGGMSAAELAFAFERLGGSLSTSIASDYLGFGSTVIADRLAEAAGLLSTVFREPVLAEEDVMKERALMLEEAAQVADDMLRFPFQLAFRAAFGDEGYGLPATGLPETLARLTPAGVREDHLLRLRRDRPVVLAVGELEPEQALSDLAGVFDSLPALEPAGPTRPQAWAVAGAPEVTVVNREKTQSAVAMAFPGLSRSDPARHAAEVWAAVASGLGGRLFESLRSRRSLAYTVLASAWQRRRGGALVTYIATAPERETEAREAMLEELAAFTQAPIEPRELDQAVNYLAGQAEVQRQSGAAVAGEILDAWVMGNGLLDVADPAAGYRAVTADEVLRVARRCLRAESRSEGIIRGK